MMDFNWIDWIILSVVGVGLLFGLMWGALRIVFFVVCLGGTFAFFPLSMPFFDGVIVPILGSDNSSNTMKFLGELLVTSAAIVVPFIIWSVLLAWPHGYIARYLNPFMNFGIGAIVGAIVGYVLIVALAILAAHGSVDRVKPSAICQSSLSPLIYSGAEPLLQLAINTTSGFADIQQFLEELSPGLKNGDPSNPLTCGESQTV